MAVIIPSLPNNLTNGTTADATQVMANFSAIVSAVNTNSANAGINTNITSITGLTTALSPSQGGTGLLTLPANGVLIGEGTNAVASAIPGILGTVLMSNGPGTDPSFQPAVPSGGMMFWPTATAPTGWVEAAGQSTTGMSAAIIAIYGATLPDMRGQFPRGWDHGRGLDPNAPALLATISDQFKSHTHTVTDPGHVHHSSVGYSNKGGSGNGNAYSDNQGGSTVVGSGDPGGGTQSSVTGITNQSTGGTETAPKYMAWMCIIKS